MGKANEEEKKVKSRARKRGVGGRKRSREGKESIQRRGRPRERTQECDKEALILSLCPLQLDKAESLCCVVNISL